MWEEEVDMTSVGRLEEDLINEVGLKNRDRSRKRR